MFTINCGIVPTVKQSVNTNQEALAITEGESEYSLTSHNANGNTIYWQLAEITSTEENPVRHSISEFYNGDQPTGSGFNSYFTDAGSSSCGYTKTTEVKINTQLSLLTLKGNAAEEVTVKKSINAIEVELQADDEPDSDKINSAHAPNGDEVMADDFDPVHIHHGRLSIENETGNSDKFTDTQKESHYHWIAECNSDVTHTRYKVKKGFNSKDYNQVIGVKFRAVATIKSGTRAKNYTSKFAHMLFINGKS